MNYYFRRHIAKRTQQVLQAQDRLVVTPDGMPPRWLGALFLLAGIAIVAAGCGEILGSVHAEGSISVPFIAGGLFALVGYGITFYRSRLEFDLTLRRWRQEQGVWPWSKVREGALSDWNHMEFDRQMRTDSSERGTTTYPVWALQLRAEDDRVPPLALTDFDFPCQYIDRIKALGLAAILAQKLNLPLREADAQDLTPLTPRPSAPLNRLSLAALCAPPTSRIRYETRPEGTICITISGSPQKALPALLPLVCFGVFVWHAEKSHQEFLSHVSADSRAFFSGSPSTLLFFSPLLVFGALIFLGVLAWRLVRKHLHITADTVTAFSSLLSREFEHRSVPRSAVRGVEMQPGASIGGSIGGGGIEFGAQARPGRDLVLVSDQADLRVGVGLTLPEQEWLQSVLLTRLGLASATPSPDSLEALEGFGEGSVGPDPATSQRSRTRVLVRRFALPLLGGITLLNSYGGGLTLVRRWRDAAGARFVSSNSLWKTHTICVDSLGQVTEMQAAYNPFGSSTHNTGSMPETEGDTSDSRWSLLLGANAEKALEKARQDAIAYALMPRNLSGSKSGIRRFQYSNNEDSPKGQRYWTQISPVEWQERDANGMTKFRVVQRTEVEGDTGITAQKQDGTGLLVFIPDLGSHKMRLRCRYDGQPGWSDLGEMTHIE